MAEIVITEVYQDLRYKQPFCFHTRMPSGVIQFHRYLTREHAEEARAALVNQVQTGGRNE